jgi:predicted GTPase
VFAVVGKPKKGKNSSGNRLLYELVEVVDEFLSTIRALRMLPSFYIEEAKYFVLTLTTT